MKLKTITLLGMIAAILSVCMPFYYILVMSEVVEYSPSNSIGIIANLIAIFSSTTIALFFYTLYKSQK